MTLKEKIVAILTERAYELKDGGTKTQVVEEADFDQIAMDIQEVLKNDYSFDPEENS